MQQILSVRKQFKSMCKTREKHVHRMCISLMSPENCVSQSIAGIETRKAGISSGRLSWPEVKRMEQKTQFLLFCSLSLDAFKINGFTCCNFFETIKDIWSLKIKVSAGNLNFGFSWFDFDFFISKRGFGGCGHGFDGCDGLGGFGGFDGFSGFGGFDGLGGFCGFDGFSGFGGFNGFSGLGGFDGLGGFCGFDRFSGFGGFDGFSGFGG